ncbi:hypothetical protein HMPREF1624_02407 [Sporothrix schenckii ATCC 58251]|uniref:Uncharacterized protein n=1 Tax=Sporothrix schenckii (strain ATCC 58251 / de Perez 2211183) TaxID=1391915 RepID=U7Q2C9_SPOS1|nr:hypothetical protein HMPREF1624_02407 [Sporothrix schenckii ATCC 58251]
MRLIETSTLEMEEFFPPKIPPYSILSHTWGAEEVSLVDFMAVSSASAKTKSSRRGFKKIVRAAQLARTLKHKYIWIDTCCIDKSSSADLTESINSMYQWYRDSEVCLAWLDDLPGDRPDRDMAHCRWFTRGWTLQELVAPRRLEFYDADWSFRGTRTAHVDRIFKRTNIPQRILLGQAHPTGYSLARRMSWAATRETTRIEDTAYCLLGICDINMPLAYGEGAKAFRRLQEEIVKKNSDLTIFAWRSPLATVPAIQVSQDEGTRPHRSAVKPVPVTVESTAVFHPKDAPGVASPAHSRATSPALPNPIETKRRSVSPSPSPSKGSRASTPVSTPLSTPTSAPLGKVLSSPNTSAVSVAASSTVADGATNQRRGRPELCLFAPSPAPFAEYASLHPFADDFENFSVTNRGLFVSGSVYLRLVTKQAVPGQSPATNHYLLLLGSQFGNFVGMYLIKVGPNIFQRDWEADMAVLKQDDVQFLRGFLVTDWYILIDKRSANTITAETFRQSSIHVPLMGHGNEYVIVKETAPTHLWDVQDRLFVRPKAYAWTRYDMVLAIKCSATLRNIHIKVPDTPDAIPITRRISFVVLCQYRHHQRDPEFVVFLEEDYPRETEMIMVRRAPNNSFMWPDLDVLCPHLTKLPDYVMVDVGERNARTGKWRSCWYRISTVLKKEKVDLEYTVPELFSLYFDVTLAENYNPAEAKDKEKQGKQDRQNKDEKKTIPTDMKKPS